MKERIPPIARSAANEGPGTLEVPGPSTRLDSNVGLLVLLKGATVRWLDRWASTLVGAPAVVYMILGCLLPLGLIVAFSLNAPHFNVANYRDLTSSGLYLPLLWNTLWISSVVTVVAVLLGYPYAYIMARARGKVALVLGAAVAFPFLTSTVVRSFTWELILNPQGIVTDLFHLVGISTVPTLLGTPAGVIIGLSQVELPFVVFPIYAALTAVHRDYDSAASSLGAGPSKAFLFVTLPLSMTGVAAGALLAFVYALGAYITPQLLGGPSSTMLGQGIATEVQTSLSWGVASTMGVVLLLATAVTFLAASLLGGRRVLGFGHSDSRP